MTANKDNLSFLIKANMDNIKASQKTYGGVYLAKIDMTDTDNCYSLEVELDEGSIAFSYSVPESSVEEYSQFILDKLQEEGIKVFTQYSDFEDAMDSAN